MPKVHHFFFELYKKLLGQNNVKKDSTNNAEPTKLIRELTGYSKTNNSKYENIRNYQVSHIFGRTKNIYAFTAPWNIVYMPKMLDPFTGHEAKGDMVDEYTRLFQKQGYVMFERLIDDFNSIITKQSFVNKLDDCLGEMESEQLFDEKDIAKLKQAVKNEFLPIEI